MTLPTNDDSSNRELSIEELDAVAAGRSVAEIVLNGIRSILRWF
jgi:hypothetical protein